MKKLMYFATALLVLAGCNKKENALNNTPEGTPFKKGQQVTLTIGTGDNNQAAPRRVAGTDNGTQINFTWEAGDQILVKVDDKTAVFTLSSEPGSVEGEFTGTMPADGSTFDIQYPTTTPDLSAQVYTEEKVIPANKMLFTATGCTLNENATLTAQYAMVQLNLYGTDKTVGKIVFWNKTGVDVPAYTLTCTGGKTIGATSATATPFYMVVPAGEYKFEVEVYDNAATPAKSCSFATSAAKTFAAGECMNMPAKEVTAVDPYNGHAYVDLGLPSGLKWATMNVGATKAEEYGDYYAWGETEPYYSSLSPLTWKTDKTNGYNWLSYFDTKSYAEGNITFIKYHRDDGGKTVLDPEDDAAAVNWGGAWRMPTYAELHELNTKCTWNFTTLNNISGYEVKGLNNNTIFLPSAGFFRDKEYCHAGEYGEYWTSTGCIQMAYGKGVVWYKSGSKSEIEGARYFGYAVRPVCE